MEKMYSEFSSFKTDMTTEVKGIRQDLTDVKKDVKGLKEDVKILNVNVDKTSLELETINNKLEIVAEVQQNLTVQTQKQIQEIMEPFSEDVSVIKSAIKHISNEATDVSDKIEFITMKEFNNERDLFVMKKKLSE
jgi:chromosome segregation ATPase